MFRPAIRIRLGLVVVLAVFGGARLFALADEITYVTVNNTSIRVEMMGTKPVFTTDRFTSGGESYFLLSFSHSVLLGSPRQRFVLPNQSATVTAAQYSDHPYVVHLLVNDQNTTSFNVATVRQPSAHYRITVDMGGAAVRLTDGAAQHSAASRRPLSAFHPIADPGSPRPRTNASPGPVRWGSYMPPSGAVGSPRQ